MYSHPLVDDRDGASAGYHLEKSEVLALRPVYLRQDVCVDDHARASLTGHSVKRQELRQRVALQQYRRAFFLEVVFLRRP